MYSFYSKVPRVLRNLRTQPNKLNFSLFKTVKMSPIVQDHKTEDSGVKKSHKADSEFLQQILRRWENDSRLEVTSVDQSPACGIGVNYMSVVNRIVVTGKRRNGSPYQISLITKNLIEDKCHQEFFQSVDIFANEARVYKTLPFLLGKDQKLVPNCLYADTGIIILEDMKSFGFSMVDKTTSLDFEHTKLVMEILAKFHAASFVLQYTEPEKYVEIRSEVKEVFFPPEADHKGLKQMLNGIPECVIFYLKAGATPEDDHSKEITYFENKSLDMYDVLKEIIKPKRHAVMCVGDCWITNLLFKYEEDVEQGGENKRVSDVRMLDFQGARFASVAIDILYFLHTSVNHEVVRERNDELVQIYHSMLKSKLLTLPKNVFDELSLDWLKNELKTHEAYGFFMSLWVAPATTIDQKHAVDGNMVASLAAKNAHTPDYMKDKISAALLTRIHDKCKYFLRY